MTLIGPIPPGGDDRRSAWNRGPEIVAAEQRILLYADGLLQFMRRVQRDGGFSEKYSDAIESFFTHVPNNARNPFTKPDEHADLMYGGVYEEWILEKLDSDNNRMLGEILRAAWELRNWRAYYGEISPEERDSYNNGGAS